MYMYVVTDSHHILADDNLVYAAKMIWPDTDWISATRTYICSFLIFVLSEVAIIVLGWDWDCIFVNSKWAS